MAEMLTTFKILPKGVDVDLEKVKGKVKGSLPPGVRVVKISEEPIAFGLVALIAHLIVPEDDPRIVGVVEERINSVEGVGEIEVTGMTRL